MSLTDQHPPAVPAEPSVRGRIAGVVRRRPLLTYLLVFNVLGQPFAFAPLIADRVYGVSLAADLVLAVPAILFMGGAALLITRIAKGPAALRALIRSALRFDVPLRWYLLPFVVFPVITPLLEFRSPATLDWRTLAAAYLTGFLPALAFNFLTTNLWEETGWQGLFQNTLQDRYGPWRAVLLTTPWFLLEHSFFAFRGTATEGAIWFTAFLIIVPPVRALMGWIYNRTGSIALVGLTHASTNAVSAGLMPVLFHGEGSAGGAYLLPGLLVLMLTRGRLGLAKPGAGTPRADRES